MRVLGALSQLAICLACVSSVALAGGCASHADGDQQSGGKGIKSAETEEQAKQATDGRKVARGMLGLPETPASPAKAEDKAKIQRWEALAEHVFFIVEAREPNAMRTFGETLAAKDAEKSAKAFATMRGKIEDAAASNELRVRVANDPLFKGVKIPTTTTKSGGIGIRAGETPVAGDIPDLGRGPDGFYGDGQTGWGARIRDIGGFVADLWPWGTLAKIDRGELTPDPESRLGAYAATRGYPPGSVGEAVHNAIGMIYITFGTYGEERIGRVFNSPEARALYNQPVDSPAGRLMAEIELRYWQNVAAEDSWSPGGELGSAFSAAFRDWLQQNIFGSQPSAEELSKTDCADKTDGWWCLDAGGGPGWMAYCENRQIAGGCGCGGCSTAGVKASCSASPPPAACPE